MPTRPELDRIILRAEQDLNDLDRSIKRHQDRRSALEAELESLREQRESWGEDNG